MPGLIQKSKAILAAVSLVFCGLAADSAISISQHQDGEVFSSKALAVSGHSAINRVRVRNRKVTAGEGISVLAITPVNSFTFHLPSAGLASSPALSSYDLSCQRSASARAPPLS